MSLDKAEQRTLLITGANGFIGRNLITQIKYSNPLWKLKAISRHPVPGIPDYLEFDSFKKGSFDKSFFEDVTHLVHLAGVAHRASHLIEEELSSINIGFLGRLIKLLNTKTLEKLVFLSSYSVTLLKKGVELDTVNYAISKEQAENVLRDWYKQTDRSFELVILRPAMVYGHGAPGNFDRLLGLLKLPAILPFGSLNFNRCFIQIRNLTTAICAVLSSPFVGVISEWDISDPWVETFNGFVKDLNHSIHGRAKIIKFPLPALKLIVTTCGKRELFEKLVLTFEIDIGTFREKYHWDPPVTFNKRFADLPCGAK